VHLPSIPCYQGEGRSAEGGMSEHRGLLGAITEALELQQQLGCSPDEAFAIQRQRAAERLKEYELENAPTNIVQFRPRGSDGLA
jgi:hypothetical protein